MRDFPVTYYTDISEESARNLKDCVDKFQVERGIRLPDIWVFYDLVQFKYLTVARAIDRHFNFYEFGCTNGDKWEYLRDLYSWKQRCGDESGDQS